jgi:predicted amidohydrolase
MDDFMLAGIQLDTIACEVRHNVHKAMLWTREAFEKGAKYVFLHEGLTADYTTDPLRYGRSLDSPEVFGFCHLAKRYNGYVALGLNEIYQGRPYIAMVWCGPEGIVGVYRKSYLWPNRSQLPENLNGDFDAFMQTFVPHEQGFRLERATLAHGDGTVVMQIGSLRIGCLICADGSQPEAWATFEQDRPDLIFWQFNCNNLLDYGESIVQCRRLRIPMVAVNRCGFSWHWFQEGGSHILAEDASFVAKANTEGREEMITAMWGELRQG